MPALVDASDASAEETPLIGFELESASVWVCRGADIEMVTAIIAALKAST